MRYFILTIILISMLVSSCNKCRSGCDHGVCIKKSCDCDTWYSGDRCDQSTLVDYEGYYRGSAQADTNEFEVGFNLLVHPDKPNSMVLDSQNIEIEFVDQSRFVVPAQVWGGQGVFGEGEMLINLISMRLEGDSMPNFHSVTIEAIRQE